MHEQIGFTVHLIEILVFLVALAAWWKQWGQIVLALSPAGDRHHSADRPSATPSRKMVAGSTPCTGTFALVVLVLAAVIAHRAMSPLGLGKSTATT